LAKTTGGQVFPERQIEEIQRQEARDLRRFDVNFDLPDHMTPELPAPIFLTTQPHLGDVSRGQGQARRGRLGGEGDRGDKKSRGTR
jgi:hypothetical protein